MMTLLTRHTLARLIVCLLAAVLAVNLSAPGVTAGASAQSAQVAHAGSGHGHHAHPTPTATATATATANPQPTATPAPTATPEPTATASPEPTAEPTPAPSPTPNPTATPAPSPSPSGWTMVLDDEFTSAGIPSHWELYDGPYGSGPTGNCAQPSQDSAPGDGYLYLTMSYQTSGPCGAGWYEGGMMVSDAYAETQQAITIRWRVIPSADPTVVRSHNIIPMIFPQTASYADAEDDLCESGQLTGCQTYLHYGGGSQVEEDYTLDLTQWHTWRFTQADGVITVTIDGALVWSADVGTSVLPDDVRRAVLQQECPAAACPPASYAGDSERIQIDWLTIAVPAA